MSSLFDTNIFLRLTNKADPAHTLAVKVYGITHLLTFNAEDFTRYPDITVVAPQHVPQT